MKNLIKFADFYKSASTFGTARVDDVESPNEEILNISTSDFLDKLYVSTPMEGFLEDKLRNDTLGKLIAVCGPSGSGKSSVSFKVKNNLKDENYFIV
jgi:pantothenate kinase-related protein Tda10